MFMKSSLLKPIAFAVLCAAAGASQAALTVYTTQASFLAAVTSPGVDTFAGFNIDGTTSSPITRSAGAYSYTATASTSTFYGAGSTADTWLSTNLAEDSIQFSGFTTGVNAIGANFFGSNIAGAFAAGDVTLTAVDSMGTTSIQVITGATTTSFLGFVSTGTISMLTLSAVQTVSPLWPTVNNLTLAAPVPEPETYALMLAGLGVIGFMARRRRG